MKTAAETGQVRIPAVGEYRIDVADSTVTFRTRHIFGMAPVSGSFRLREGHIRVAEEVTESTAYAAISAASFHTGLSNRDSMIRSLADHDAGTPGQPGVSSRIRVPRGVVPGSAPDQSSTPAMATAMAW